MRTDTRAGRDPHDARRCLMWAAREDSLRRWRAGLTIAYTQGLRPRGVIGFYRLETRWAKVSCQSQPGPTPGWLQIPFATMLFPEFAGAIAENLSQRDGPGSRRERVGDWAADAAQAGERSGNRDFSSGAVRPRCCRDRRCTGKCRRRGNPSACRGRPECQHRGLQSESSTLPCRCNQ